MTIFHFSIKYKFGTKRCSDRSKTTFLKSLYFLSTKNLSFLEFPIRFKETKAKKQNFQTILDKTFVDFFTF